MNGSFGGRIRSLREAMDLSLRDLADRSGVSAPMLSQVERGETSPTLALAERIAMGLELSLSQLLRLDETDGVSVVRAGERRRGGRPSHRYEVLTPPLPGLRAEVTRHTLELFPQLEHARLLRSWAGLCDLSPDYSPILGKTEVDNFHVSAGWGTYGFKAAPIVGKTLAELVDTGRTPDLIAPFALERFYEDKLVSELAAAAVSH